MNAKKFFVVLMAVLMLGAAGTTFAGDRHGSYRGDYGHRGGSHHHSGRDVLLGAVIGGLITGAVVNAQRQGGYYQQQCWMESRPLYDARGQYVTNSWVQVCAQN